MKTRCSIFFVIVFTILYHSAKCQNYNIDSLKKALVTNTANDTNKVKLFYLLSNAKSNLNPKNAINDALQGLRIAYSLNYFHGQGICLNALGVAYYQLGNFDTALIYFNKEYKIAVKLVDSIGIARALDNISVISLHFGKMDEALNKRKTALGIYQRLGKNKLVANGYLWIGNIYKHQGKFTNAIDYYFKALDIYTKVDDTNGKGYAYINLSSIYRYQNDFRNAKKYVLDAKKAFFETKYSNGVGMALYRLSLIYYDQKKYYQSIKTLKETKLIFDRTSYNYGIGLVFNQLALSYKNIGLIDSAITYFKSAFSYAKSAGDVENVIVSQQGLGGIYYQNRKYNKALEYFNHSVKLAKREDDLIALSDASYYLIKIYGRIFKPDSVSKYLAVFQAASDSLNKEKYGKEIVEMQTRFDTEQKEGQINNLKRERELQDLKGKQSKLYFLIIVISVIFIALLFIMYFIKRLKTKELDLKKEKILNEAKTGLYKRIAHELRTPLTLIMGPLDKLSAKSDNPSDKADLLLATNYSKKLHKRINSLLTLSELEVNDVKMHSSEENIVDCVQSYTQSFKYLARQKNISLIFNSNAEQITAYIDKEKFEQIIENLMSNALKFTNEGGVIKVEVATINFYKNHHVQNKYHSVNEFVEIKIEDNGCGIPPENINKIYDLYYHFDNSNAHKEGFGIGLTLIKQLVKLHHGYIEVKSELNKGTSFSLFFPIEKNHFKTGQINMEKNKGSEWIINRKKINEPGSKINIPEPVDCEKPVLLIVEDNADMRNYIRKFFEQDYTLYEAVDGKKGYELALKTIPEIIISDIMMPVMDGNELCQKLKTNELTCHIPVILLTALASEEQKIKGLEQGADDYITKPFRGEELILKVRNQLAQQKRNQAYIENKIKQLPNIIEFDIDNYQMTTYDYRFLSGVKNVVNEKFCDSNFNVDGLCKELSMSKGTLNRKLQAITGMTPHNFIRMYRLKVAEKLLKELNDANISDIGYATGFSSPSYFVSQFKDYFGETPNKFRNINN